MKTPTNLTAVGHRPKDGTARSLTTLWLPMPLRVELVRMAALQGVTLSAVMRQVIERGLGRDERSQG